MRVPLIGGAYSTRSIIGSAQRCINYYPEPLPRYMQSVAPMTSYQRPGLVPQTTIGTGPIRGLFQLSNGEGYCVSGSQLFRVNPDWTVTFLGNITAGRTNPVYMVDNNDFWMLVDGSNQGWWGDMTGRTLLGTGFGVVNDPNVPKVFEGGDRIDFIDRYFIWNQPGTRFWGSTVPPALDTDPPVGFDPDWTGAKSAWPDNIQALYVNRHEVILLGRLKSEVWYNAGNPVFPFSPLPGAYIEHGAISKYSTSDYDIETYWLAQNLHGNGVVNKFKGYTTSRISNFALEFQIRRMIRTVGVGDAIGFTMLVDGHPFYMLQFPAGDQTWVFDASIEDANLAWHQECCVGSDGQLHRHRANCHAVINGLNVVGDHTLGTVYRLDLDSYVDVIEGQTRPITCIRSFPHLGQGRLGGSGQMVNMDGRRVQFARFQLDLECGTAPLDVSGNPAQVVLRWSDDRGRTWGTDVLQTAGAPGRFETWPQWLGLGMARDRVFEIQHSIAAAAACQGAFIDCEVAGT